MSLFTLNNSVIPCPTKSQNGGCTRNWFQSITAKAGNNGSSLTMRCKVAY